MSDEQECEFWKKELDKTHLLMLKRQDELVKEILKNDQLKAEIEEYKQALQEVKNLASCGKDMYMERGKYENYVAMAEWMKNQFYFILQKCEVLKDE